MSGDTRQAIYPDLAGRSVIVTGGGSGIGAAITRAFVAQKAKVGFIDIAEAPSRALVAELGGDAANVRYIRADLTDVGAMQAAIGEIARAHGDADVLVNNAGWDERHAAEATSVELFDKIIAVNLRHAFFAAQAVLPGMKAKGGGAIVNFSSISWMAGSGGMPIYTAAKSAMIGLTRSLARDFGPHNVRVNAVAPGWVKTERQVEKWLTPESDKARLDAQCLKTWVLPEDIARFVLFLASQEARVCTGQHYVVDAGWV
ncbi:MAG: SDR family oxidoreductase [Hyphomicrobiales bacterium]|nr:SDR family oxidoreductase [Hyphomicrobiales bacterium]